MLRSSSSSLALLVLCVVALFANVASAANFTYLADEKNVWPGADLHPFVCSPSGLQTAVPINSSFSGLGIFRYNDDTHTLSYTIYHNAGSYVLFTQISVGGKGQFKGPSYILNNTNPIVGIVHLNQTLGETDRLKNGTLYFELRTTKNPDGELRCQIVKNSVNGTAEFASMLFPPSVVNATKKYNESFSSVNGTMYATYNYSTNLLVVKVMHNLQFARTIGLYQHNKLMNETVCNTTKCNITMTFRHNSTEKALNNNDFYIKITNNVTYIAANLKKIDEDERNALCNGPCYTYKQRFWDLRLTEDLFNPRRDNEQIFLSVPSGLNTINTTCYQCLSPFNSTFSSIGVYTFNRTSKLLSWIIYQTAGNQTIFNQISQGSKGSFRVPTFVLGTTNVTSPLIGNATLNSTLVQRLHNSSLYYELRTILHPDGELRGQITNNTANFTTEFAGVMRHPDPIFGRYNGTVYGQYNFTTNTILVKVIHNLPLPRNISLVWLHSNRTLNMSLCNTTKCNISLTIDSMKLEKALLKDDIVVVVENAITRIASKLYKTDLDVRIPFDPTLDSDQILAIALFSAATLLCVLIGLAYRMWRWYKLYKAGKAYMIVPHIIREAIACGKEGKAYFSKKGRKGMRKAKKEAIKAAAHTMNQDMGHAVDPIVEDLREDVK